MYYERVFKTGYYSDTCSEYTGFCYGTYLYIKITVYPAK